MTDELPQPDDPDRVFLSIFVDIRDIIALYDPRDIPQPNIGFEAVPKFTFRCRDTLQRVVVDDVKKQITTYIWDHIHQRICTSDFVLLFNPSLVTQHRWTYGFLKLDYTLTWMEVLHRTDLPLNTLTIKLETCTTSRWQWLKDHRMLSPPRLIRQRSPV